MAAAGNSSFAGSLYVSMGLDQSSFVSGFVAAKAVAKQSTDQISGEIAKMNTATRGASQGMAMLGQQVSDIGVQATMGTNPFMIFSQQIPQVTYALSTMSGAVGKVGAALSGPFGAAAIAAIGFIGMFASKTREANREAAEAANGGLKSLSERMKELAGAGTQSFNRGFTSLSAEFVKQAESDVKRLDALRKREAELRQTLSEIRGRSPSSGAGAVQQAGEIRAIEAQLSAASKETREFEKSIRGTVSAYRDMEVALGSRRVDEALDKQVKLKNAFEDQKAALEAQLRAGQITRAQYEQSLLRETQSYNAQVEAIKAKEEATKDALKSAQEYAESLKEVVAQALPGNAAITEYNQQLRLFKAAADAGMVSAENYAIGVKNLRDAMLDSVAGPSQKAAIETWNSKDALKFDLEGMDAFTKEYAARMKQVEKSNRDAQQSAMMFATTVTSGFSDALFSGKSLGSMFKGLVNDIGQMAIKMLILTPIAKALAKALEGLGGNGIFGLFGGARANGGPVSAGQTYLVGERGPELFTPGVSGSILPNNKVEEMMRGGRGPLDILVSPSPYFDITVKRISGQVAMETTSMGAMGTLAETDRRAGYRAKTNLAGF